MDFNFTRFEGNLLFFIVPAFSGILLWLLELHFKNKELVNHINNLEKFYDDKIKKSMKD